MFKKMRFRTKLSLAVSLMITAMMIISATVLSRIMVQNTRQNWDRTNRQVFNSLLLAIQNEIESMDKISKDLHTSEKIRDAFQSIPEQDGNYFNHNPLLRDRLSSEIYSALGSSPMNGQITVVSRYGDYVYVDNRAGDRALTPEEVLAQEEVRWGFMTDGYLRVFFSPQDLWHADRSPTFTLARPLRTSYETLGVIMYSVPLETLDKLCKTYLLDSDIYIALLDMGQKVYYEYSGADQKITLTDWYNEDQIDVRGSYDLSHARVQIESIGNTGIRLAQVMGLRKLYGQIRQLQLAIIASHAVVLICVLLMANLMMWKLSAPLQKLRAQVDRISLDGDPLVTENHENNEINALSDAIAEMVQRFRRQNEQLLLAHERDMQSSLNAMEAQLNSHFLYNTLAVIGAVGQMEGSKTAPRLCAKLASLLRYSVDFNFKCVTLGDELDNVRDYLDIMSMRYVEQTDFVWDLDPAANSVEVPKLILQPIVENCFKHGFDNREGLKRIRIVSRCDGVRWSVEVRNNGEPMSQETIDGIYMRFAQYREEISRDRLDARSFGAGFGLGNTILRLYLFYKSDETFRIEVEEEETVVAIGGPIHAK